MTLQVIYGNQIGSRILVGEATDKPATGQLTELFMETDTNKIYNGTGSGWTLLTDIAHNTGTGADHSFIDQSVVSGSAPVILGTNVTSIPRENVNITTGSGVDTVNDLEKLMFHTGSVGILHAGDGLITDEGATKFQVAAGEGLLRLANSTTSPLISIGWAATDILYTSLVTGNIYYIYIENVTGTPTIQITDTYSVIEHIKDIDLGFIWFNGENLIVNNPSALYNLPDRQHETITEIFGYTRVEGAMIGEPANLKLSLTASKWYLGFTEFLLSAIDTNVADTFTYFHRTAGVWTEVAAQTSIDNTYYNDTTSGLVALTVNKYGVHWIYLNANGGLYVVYGEGDYTIATALAAATPATLPPQFAKFCKLVGKAIVQKSGAALTYIQSPFTVDFEVGTTTVHNETSGLNDDDYKHLSAINFTDLTNAGDSTLHYHASDRLIANVTDMENQTFVNLLKNGNLESWSAGTSSPPDRTIASITGGGSINRESTTVKVGTYSAKLINGVANLAYLQYRLADNSDLDHARLGGRIVTGGVWVYATDASRVKLGIYDNQGAGFENTDSSFHGGSGWEYLTVSKTIRTGLTDFLFRVITTSGSAITIYIDGFMLVLGSVIPDFIPCPLEDDGKTIVIDSPTNTATIENVTISQTLIKSVTNGITAYAGGGQANAVALTSDINEVSVCASGGDSTKLPAALVGMEIVVINHGAAAMDLFPISGDFINEAAVDVATSIAIDATVICYCYTNDYWEVVEVGR